MRSNAEQPDDLRTLTELLLIGNTLDPNIQLELDVPSLQGGKLPLLDLKVWVHNNKIRHEFYKKPMASRHLILSRSALSDRTKHDSIFQEGMRRMWNCDQDTTKERLHDILGEFSNAMRLSGYSWAFRNNIIGGILERKRQVEREITEGRKIRYRTRKEIDIGKNNKKGRLIEVSFGVAPFIMLKIRSL